MFVSDHRKKPYFQQTHNVQAFFFFSPEKALFTMITRISVSTIDSMYLLHMGQLEIQHKALVRSTVFTSTIMPRSTC